jgi:gamma-butyrobetaine dioxygenase
MSLAAVNIIEGGAAVLLRWKDDESARFHALWLRDNALDPETRSVSNGQRLITILDIPRNAVVATAELTSSGDLSIGFEPEERGRRSPPIGSARAATIAT